MTKSIFTSIMRIKPLIESAWRDIYNLLIERENNYLKKKNYYKISHQAFM